MLRSELFLWRNQRRRKFCVSDHAIECEEGRGENKRPEDDAAGERMDSLGQRNQTGHAGNDQREQTHRREHRDTNNDLPRARVLGSVHVVLVSLRLTPSCSIQTLNHGCRGYRR